MAARQVIQRPESQRWVLNGKLDEQETHVSWHEAALLTNGQGRKLGYGLEVEKSRVLVAKDIYLWFGYLNVAISSVVE